MPVCAFHVMSAPFFFLYTSKCPPICSTLCSYLYGSPISQNTPNSVLRNLQKSENGIFYLMQGQLYDIYGKWIFARALPHISEWPGPDIGKSVLSGAASPSWSSARNAVTFASAG